MRAIFVSPVSATFELQNDLVYYAEKPFSVYLNGKQVLRNIKTNVFSLYELTPDTKYVVKAGEKEIEFTTSKANKVYEVNPTNEKEDRTKEIQTIIDGMKKDDVIVFNEGVYYVTPIRLKSHITAYFKKNAVFSASVIENDFPQIDEEEKVGKKVLQRGTWEGLPAKMKLGLISCIDCDGVNIVGEGTINMNALESTWFVDFRKKEYARPHTLFINQSKNIYVQGVTLKNACTWTVHPYYCSNIGFYDFGIFNKKDSPNTDGIDPQCVDHCEIIGVHFDVGDDCIAIKSGKMGLVKICKKNSSDITVRNCFMENGHGAIVLGSEMSCGIEKLDIERCLFDHTDRGLRIKTRRGRGKDAVIDGVKFSHILMNNVLTPFVMNMFYFCDPDGKTEFVWSKEKLPVDETTPYLGKFLFEDIECKNSEFCAGYFYGLPEQKIGEIHLKNVNVSFKLFAKKGNPAMMSFAEELSKSGFVFNNVNKVILENVKVSGCKNKDINLNGVEDIVRR